nr:YceK/YidQ family lipoprotein [Pseudomonas sp. BJa5]MDL2429484.1 YceK/YidQ family lipoprotein [Pseudomonas sp. BJa5]
MQADAKLLTGNVSTGYAPIALFCWMSIVCPKVAVVSLPVNAVIDTVAQPIDHSWRTPLARLPAPAGHDCQQALPLRPCPGQNTEQVAWNTSPSSVADSAARRWPSSCCALHKGRYGSA